MPIIGPTLNLEYRLLPLTLNADGSAMVRLNQAYAVLSCPHRRAEFDHEQSCIHPHMYANRFNNGTYPNASSASRGPVVVLTYDHRGRLHAYA